MKQNTDFAWTEFFQELSERLLEYKENRPELISKVYEIFKNTKLALPKFEEDKTIVDMDPFSVLALSNKNLAKEPTRNKIAVAMKDVFKLTAKAPAHFEGIPVINSWNAVFFPPEKERKGDEFEILWSLFSCALALSEKDTLENREKFSAYFDGAIHISNNGTRTLTKGLYWAAPETFLNLDEATLNYIYDSGVFPESIVESLPDIKKDSQISASNYLQLIDLLEAALALPESPVQSFKELNVLALAAYSQLKQKLQDKEKERDQKTGAAIGDDGIKTTRSWLYSPGEKGMYWEEFYKSGIMAIGWDEIGDLSSYSSKAEMIEEMKEQIDPTKSFTHSAGITWSFLHEMHPGDIVYAKKGIQQILGKGIVESDYIYDESRETFRNVRKVRWTDSGEWPSSRKLAQKTLTDISDKLDLLHAINELMADPQQEDLEEEEAQYPDYDAEQFLSEVFMSEEEYHKLVWVLENKKNLILQGAPGVGKTFTAKRLAYSMLKEKNSERVRMIQFHQNYSYEDFIMGFRPNGTFYDLKQGPFYQFCKKAQEDREHSYFFIIDEINRGNLNRIFGELFMLLEKDKRNIPLQLLYSEELFSIPDNVYLIGLMNTADRSLALIDYALRRRFAFYTMKPGFASQGFKTYQQSFHSQKLDRLIQVVEELNLEISQDETLGDGFCIGHSFFCDLPKDEDLDSSSALKFIVEFELIPLLKEYWFDEPDKIQTWSESLRNALA